MRYRILATLAAVVALFAGLFAAPASAQTLPTVVLVHGAFADATSWDGVAADLRGRGYTVVTPDNPLRGPAYDSAAIRKALDGISGPVVLVGHSYGGMVISQIKDPKVKSLVYVAAFGPAQYEPVMLELDPIRFPGSRLLPPALEVKVVDDPTGPGGKNLDGYVAPRYFHEVFAQDVSDATAATMLAHQKSAALVANLEPSGPPSWASSRNWYVVAGQDRVIPPASQRFMAQRMKATVTEVNASHAVLVSQPVAVANVIVAAGK
ncbi:alpha/beta hydrolase [Aldersonia kunmingensis]|uniref:alpha/beta hydrolase n=1 Tax=Aldersonia kunmingensis TaxID=408066 RepID=UPI00082F96DA|nr:alpha/beta hydrolase [Aldersonia kunmingensis]